MPAIKPSCPLNGQKEKPKDKAPNICSAGD